MLCPLSLVGRPYAFPSEPPMSFDCWSLVKHVRTEARLSCPLTFSDDEAWCTPDNIAAAIVKVRGAWGRTDTPRDLDMAVMDAHHVGVVYGRGVVHALARHTTVVWTSRAVILRLWPNTEWWTA